MTIQDLRRALWAINHAAGMLKGGENMISFYLVQRQERSWRLEISLLILSMVKALWGHSAALSSAPLTIWTILVLLRSQSKRWLARKGEIGVGANLVFLRLLKGRTGEFKDESR